MSSDPSFFYYNMVQAIFKPPKPIRGGIPICFPQVCTSNDNISVFHDCFHRDNTALEGKLERVKHVIGKKRVKHVFIFKIK